MMSEHVDWSPSVVCEDKRNIRGRAWWLSVIFNHSTTSESASFRPVCQVRSFVVSVSEGMEPLMSQQTNTEL